MEKENEKDKRLQELILENAKLKAAVPERFVYCKDCTRCKRAGFYTMHYCPMLGYVDINEDGCTKGQPKKEKING